MVLVDFVATFLSFGGFDVFVVVVFFSLFTRFIGCCCLPSFTTTASSVEIVAAVVLLAFGEVVATLVQFFR